MMVFAVCCVLSDGRGCLLSVVRSASNCKLLCFCVLYVVRRCVPLVCAVCCCSLRLAVLLVACGYDGCCMMHYVCCLMFAAVRCLLSVVCCCV